MENGPGLNFISASLLPAVNPTCIDFCSKCHVCANVIPFFTGNYDLAGFVYTPFPAVRGARHARNLAPRSRHQEQQAHDGGGLAATRRSSLLVVIAAAYPRHYRSSS